METTSRLGLKKLLEDGADAAAAYREAINANAEQLDDALPLLLVAHGASVEAKSGELLKMTATGTVTLPAAVNNAIVGVFCEAAETTIKTTGGHIYGDFITGAASIKLLLNQHVILQSDGTNWYIIAGEPKNENKYQAEEEIAPATPYTPSTTRHALVSLTILCTEGIAVYLNVGGVNVAKIPKGEWVSFCFETNPGESWEITSGAGVSVQSNYSYKVK